MAERTHPGLERSCSDTANDWAFSAPSEPGINRLEARFNGFAYHPHRHDTYAIGCTLTGVQRFDYRGQQHDSTPGRTIVLHPDEEHNGRAAGEDGFQYRMIYLDPGLIRDALDSPTGPLPFIADAVSINPELADALHATFVDMDRPLEPLQRDHSVQRIADALAAGDQTVRPKTVSSIDQKAVRQARDYLQESRTMVTSEELETVTGLDRYRLARQFRKFWGTSPYRFLTMRRLERASAAILRGQSLADTAADAGFADQSHMTRLFNATYGISPGRWRQLHQLAKD